MKLPSKNVVHLTELPKSGETVYYEDGLEGTVRSIKHEEYKGKVITVATVEITLGGGWRSLVSIQDIH